jgi:hypothetical protein
MCAAQYFRSDAVDDLKSRRRKLVLPVICSPTLVLEPCPPDFSTDAANSALISTINLRATTQFQQRDVRRRQKNKKTKAIFWLSREGTPCHGRSFLDDNS